MVIRICIIRHSKSGSNLLKERGQNGQDLRDPGLTVLGRKAAHEYSPRLQKILEDNGFDIENTTVGASPLRRAQETAHSLFPNNTIHVFGQLNEHGDIPENIPRCNTSTRKGWMHFLKWLDSMYASKEGVHSIIAVGHRTFFRREVLKPLRKNIPMNNMDAAILEYDGDKTKFIKHIFYDKKIPTNGDRYISTIRNTNIKNNGYSMKHHRKQKRSMTQKGGGSLPLAYFQDGAQSYGRSDTPTGLGIGATNYSWTREPITQRGGVRKSCKCQRGGFPPAIMGQFVENGLSLIPAAGYMLYRSGKKTLRRRSRTRKN